MCGKQSYFDQYLGAMLGNQKIVKLYTKWDTNLGILVLAAQLTACSVKSFFAFAQDEKYKI